MTQKDDIKRRAAIAAIDQRIDRLTYGLPLGILAGMMGYAMAGPIGVVGVICFGAFTLRDTHKRIWADKEAIAKDDRATLIKYTPKGERATLREVYAAEQPAPTPPPPAPTVEEPAESSTMWHPTKFNRDEILGYRTGVIVMGESGSGKSTLCRYLAEGLQDNPILVLDPHFDPSRNPWGDGATVIKEKEEILAALAVLLQLLEEGDRRPLTVIFDELPSVRVFAQKQKNDIVDDFVLRFGSECRKFKKLAILGSQSGNVKSLGLEGQGDFLLNYTQIALGRIAVKRLRNSTARDAYFWAQTIPYPYLIDDHITGPHPCLGHYVSRLDDNPPEGLGTISPPPLYPDVLARVVAHHTTPPPPTHGTPGNTPTTPTTPHQNTPTTPHQNTPQHTTGESCPRCGSTDTISNGATRSGIPRRRCKSCGATFSTPATPAEPILWGV